MKEESIALRQRCASRAAISETTVTVHRTTNSCAFIKACQAIQKRPVWSRSRGNYNEMVSLFLPGTTLWIFLSNPSLYGSNVFTAWGTSAHRLEGILSFSFHIGAAPRCGRPSTRWKSQLRYGRPRKKTATGPWDESIYDRLLTCQPFQNPGTNAGNQPWGY